MGKLRPFVRKDSYMPNKKWIPFVIGNGYTTTDGASGPAPEYETVTGNPVSFNAITPFPLRQLKVAFSPVQDLHGYDAPWPAGGGKNKIGLGGRTLSQSPSFNPTDTIALSDKEYYAGFSGTGYYRPNSAPTSINIDGGSASFTTTSEWYGLGFPISVEPNTTYTLSYASATGGLSITARFHDNQGAPISATGVTSTFETPATAAYAIIVLTSPTAGGSISVTNLQIEKGSTPTSYSPYSNECPISGWDSLTVEQRGKNLSLVDASHIDKPSWYPYTWAGSSVSGANGLTVTRSNSQGGCGGFFISGLRQGKYTLSTDVDGSTAGNYRVYVYYSTDGSDINQLPNNALTVVGSRGSCVIGIPADTYQVAIRMCASEFATGFAETKFNEIQLELGSTASEYQPYTGRSISITLGQTVYSGVLDVVTGVVTVTMASVDMGTLNCSYNASFLRFDFYNVTPKPKSVGSNVIPNALCEIYKTVKWSGNGGSAGADKAIFFDVNLLRLRDTTFTDAATLLRALSGVKLVYELAEPLTIQLTPQEVESLAGDNTMWSNANQPITVEYRSN